MPLEGLTVARALRRLRGQSCRLRELTKALSFTKHGFTLSEQIDLTNSERMGEKSRMTYTADQVKWRIQFAGDGKWRLHQI